jgi:hypothetical protein
MSCSRQRVRALNDTLRKQHRGGTIVITQGVQALGAETIQRIDVAISAFEMLHEANTLLNGVTLLNRMWRDRAAEPEPETGFLIGPPPFVRVLATSRFTGSSWMRMPEES